MTTKKRLAEQIYRRLKGHVLRSSSDLSEREVQLAMMQVIARLLKLESVNINSPFGSTPSHAMVATYEGVEVEAINDDYCRAKLPVQPVALPMGQGIFLVYKPDCFDCPFIPIDTGMMQIARGTKHNKMAAILGKKRIPYVPEGNYIRIARGKAEVGDTLTMQLLVIDPDTIDEYTLLPVPNDMESTVIMETMRIFIPELPKDLANDGTDKP